MLLNQKNKKIVRRVFAVFAVIIGLSMVFAYMPGLFY